MRRPFLLLYFTLSRGPSSTSVDAPFARFDAPAAEIEEQASDVEFDIPYRELGFYGVPPHNKSTCYVMPAVHALVELTEPPWFVVPLNDIEVHAHAVAVQPARCALRCSVPLT